MRRALRIYLCDLVHTTAKAHNYTVPLNIGWIASLTKERFGAEVDVTLFKYPDKLIAALRSSPPDVLGLSNYMWNYELNRLVARVAKQHNPDATVVSGGPNIRHSRDGYEEFLTDQRDIDIYVKFEGERAFEQIVTRVIGNSASLLDEPIPGCTFLREGEVCDGGDLPQTSKTIDYPSPYLGGALDSFLDDSFIPIFETNRGCPFKCTFCAWGVAALDRVSTVPLERVFEEMRYVSRRRPDAPLWIYADANFGMLSRDIEIAGQIREIADRSDSLHQVLIWWAKNSGERTKAIAKILGPLSVPYVAMQSLDDVVLANIKRDNISIKKLLDLMNYYHDNGLKVTTDILLGLPGETRDSHYDSLRRSLEYGFDSVKGANLILLPGTEVEEPKDRKKYEIKGMYRLRAGCYGRYDGVPVMEFEEIVTATSSMKREEFLEFRKVHWLVVLLWNTGYARPLLRLANHKGLNPIDVIKLLAENNGGNYEALRKLFIGFDQEAKSELFPSLNQARDYYSNAANFRALEMDRFGKLNFRYTAYFLLDKRLSYELFLYIRDLIESAVTLEADERSALSELVECCFARIFFVNGPEREHELEVGLRTIGFLGGSKSDKDINESRNIEVDVETASYIEHDGRMGDVGVRVPSKEDRFTKRFRIKFITDELEQQAIRVHLARLHYETNQLKAMEKALEFMRMMSFVRKFEVQPIDHGLRSVAQ